MSIESETVVDRLRRALGVSSDTALAHSLGVDKSTVSGWRRRDSNKPLEYCKQVAEQKGVSLDWLVLGRGKMYRGPGADLRGTRSDPAAGTAAGEESAGMETGGPGGWSAPAPPASAVADGPAYGALSPRLAALVGLLDQLPPEAREQIIQEALARASTAQQLADLRQALGHLLADCRRAS